MNLNTEAEMKNKLKSNESRVFEWKLIKYVSMRVMSFTRKTAKGEIYAKLPKPTQSRVNYENQKSFELHGVMYLVYTTEKMNHR